MDNKKSNNVAPIKENYSFDSKNEKSENKVKMSKNLTAINGIGVVVGTIIGSGIFISPVGIYKASGSIGASLLIWVLCGIFSFFGAYSYAELGTLIKRSGGDYAYIYQAFGPFIAFIRLWVEVLVNRPCSIAIIALTFAKYVIDPIFSGCDKPETAIRLLAALCILILAAINSWSVRWATTVQDVFMFAKVAAIIMLIITGFVKLGQGHFENWETPFAGTTTDAGSMCMAFYSGLFAYNGWSFLNCVIEEMRNPRKDLPIAIIFSLIFVTAIYTLVNVAYFTILSPSELLASQAVAVTISRRLYGVMWWIIPVFVSFSTFGSVNGTILTTSRIFYVAGQDGLMPKSLAMVNYQRKTPVVSIIISALVSLVYLCVTDVDYLMRYVGFVTWLGYAVAVLSLVVFRFTMKDIPRVIKVPIVIPIIYLIVSVLLIVFAFIGGPKESSMGVIITVSSIPAYIIFVMWKKKPTSVNNFIDSANKAIQQLFLSTESDKEL